jgi:hypothetical protein
VDVLTTALDAMDPERSERCARWLGRVGQWAGSFSDRPAAVACEVVRGIVDVDDPEWTAALAWCGRPLTTEDWSRALILYGREWSGPYRPEVRRAELLRVAAEKRDRRAVRELV